MERSLIAPGNLADQLNPVRFSYPEFSLVGIKNVAERLGIRLIVPLGLICGHDQNDGTRRQVPSRPDRTNRSLDS